MNNMCHKKFIKVLVMILKSSISLIRKMFESNMYFIRTEIGAVVFQPETFSENDVITDNDEE